MEWTGRSGLVNAKYYSMPNIILSKGTNDASIELGKVIRFSGVRDDELEARLCASGHDCSSSSSVTKSTDYLIVPFKDYTSTKVEKARKYNESNPNHKIKIVTLDEFKFNESSYLREV